MGKNLYKLFTILVLLSVSAIVHAETSIDLVRVYKSEQKLQLIAGTQIVREFHVVFGSNPKGQKLQISDGRTPEGEYVLDYKKADSSFHKAIHISYPNSQDIAQAKIRNVSPGGQVMIHGQKNGLSWLAFISQHFNWTNGCIALENSDMDEVWNLVQTGTKIQINP